MICFDIIKSCQQKRCWTQALGIQNFNTDNHCILCYSIYRSSYQAGIECTMAFLITWIFIWDQINTSKYSINGKILMQIHSSVHDVDLNAGPSRLRNLKLVIKEPICQIQCPIRNRRLNQSTRWWHLLGKLKHILELNRRELLSSLSNNLILEHIFALVSLFQISEHPFITLISDVSINLYQWLHMKLISISLFMISEILLVLIK